MKLLTSFSVPNRLPVASVAASLLTLLVACGEPPVSEQIAAARASLQKRELPTAAVQLKAALQQEPQSAELRFLLGDTLLKMGDYSAAALELNKAADLGYDEEKLLSPLVKSMVAVGRAREAVERYGDASLKDPRATAELKVALASAYALLGQTANLDSAVAAALQSDPQNAEARVMRARSQAARGAIDEALQTLSTLLANSPQNREALHLQGELLWNGRGDLDAAIKAFQAVLALDAKYMPAHAALIAIHIKRQDPGAFKAQFEALQRALPNHPETRFYEAQIALAGKDLKKARELSDKLLRAGADNPRVLQLAGAVEAEDGSLVKAEAHLAKALQLAPNMPYARQLLADTYLRTGQAERALTTLKPSLESPRPSAEVLSLAAEAYLQAGEPRRAEELFARAVEVNPKDTKAQTSLALAQIALDNKAGFERLEAIAAEDKNSAYADLALIGVLMRRNELDAALKAVDRLEAKSSQRPTAQHLRGRILVAKNDRAGARAAFERALGIDPAFFPATASLASLDVLEGKSDSAIQRYEDARAKDPKNARVLLGLAEMRMRNGAPPSEIEALLKSAVLQSPTESSPRVLLIDHYLANGNPKAALVAAQEAVAALRNDAPVMGALGRAQIASGAAEQAIATFKQLVTAHPHSPYPLLGLADAHLLAKDTEAARQDLQKALALAPGLVVAQQRLVQLALTDQRWDKALAAAQLLQKTKPKETVGWVLESEIQAHQQKWPQALAAARRALERQRSSELGLKVFALQTAAGDRVGAERFAAAWMKERPEDIVFMSQLGVVAMERRDYAGAEKTFRGVLSIKADDASALNNLAWLLLQQNKPGALPLAERANALTPNRSPVMDTLAAALAADGQLEQALAWQRKAVDAAPTLPIYRLNLAKLLVKAGRKSDARTELERLAKLGDRFAGQAEVVAQLNAL